MIERVRQIRYELKVDPTVYASIHDYSQLKALTEETGLLLRSEVSHGDTDRREVMVELLEPGRFEERRYTLTETAQGRLKIDMRFSPSRVRRTYGERESKSSRFLRRIFNIDSIVREPYQL